MIVYEIYKNGSLLCKAGREDLDLLNAIITSHCKEQSQELSNTMRVGGFVGGNDKNQHPDWLSFEN